ncbi:hypothetical protein [Streptomyces sp. NPDC126503]|uniref:hypothetical protein n=1 Tax=Streptomyces sp. NPDC126503 TaxID=3155315 RepID=UPI0033261709
MSTDIHGGIEFRHPGVDAGYHDGEPWVRAMALWPLYDDSDHAAFGCLFGACNDAGFRPLAAGRGLPADLSGELRAVLEPPVRTGEFHGATWADWAEIARLDPGTVPDSPFTGRLSWSKVSRPSLVYQRLVPDRWPAEVVDLVGPPPAGLDRAARLSEWSSGDLLCRYEPLTAGALLGAGSPWSHVFAVMKALADRFGEKAVRLVVAFG